MLRELLGRELAWKVAPYMAMLAALAWPFVSTQPASNPPLFAALCFANVVVARFHQRATPFEAALPIPGRQLVAARLLAVSAMLWIPALAVMVETLVLRGWKDAIPLLEMAAVLSVAALLVQSLRIREASPLSAQFAYALGFVGVGFSLFPRPLSHWGAVLGISFAAGAALLARLWVSVPDSFQIAPARATRVMGISVGRLWSERAWLPVWWPAWRSFINWRDWWSLIFLVFVIQTGMSMAIGAWFLKPAMAACQRLEWLLVLPISRRRLLLMMLLPWFCVLVVLLLLIWRTEFPAKHPMVSTGYSATWQEKKATGTGTPNVLVPSYYWHWAWGRRAPAVESPWGEKTEPPTFHRLGLVFYNPYSVATNNSARFLDWQFTRAKVAVYGRSFTLSQLAESPKSGLIPVARQLRTQCIAVATATLFFLGTFYLAFWSKAKGRRLWAWLVGICIFVLVFSDGAFTADQVRKSGPLSETLTIQFAALLPQNWLALIGLAVLLLGGLYLAVERQFERIDLIPSVRPTEGRE